jgi:glycosyltransferase involved in cell wall biosynthesis
MNIVVLADTVSVTGGNAKITLDGARAMAMAGHQVHLVCGIGSTTTAFQKIPNLTLHCLGYFDIHQDPNRLRAMTSGWWNARSRKYVADLLDSLNPENTIVHVHSWSRGLSFSVVRAALERGYATVFTLHDFVLACPTGTLFNQQSQTTCTLRPLSIECVCTNCDVRSYHHKLWRVGRHLILNHFGQLSARARHFIFYSQLARDVLAPHLPHDSNFYYVPNAIEVEKAEPVDVSNNDVYTFLGRLTPEKGGELFARAAAAEGLPCQFIGEGSAAAAIARVNPGAILSGWMTHEDALAALRRARVLVFPSLWYETLGLVVLEAAGIGVPAIVPDSCAARESVVDGVTGFHFRSGDESDLRTKLAALQDPALVARMGRAAYDKFWSAPGWSLKQHGEGLARTYRTLLNSRKDSEVPDRHKDESLLEIIS